MIFIVLSLPDFKTDADMILNKISFLFVDDDKNIKLLLLNNFILILKLSEGQNMERLSRLLKSSLLCKELDVQTISLAIIRDNCSNIFFSSTASELYPALKECAFKSSAINVQVNAIIALSKLLKYIKDKIKLDDMIHQLCSLSTTEPATALSLLGALQTISKYCKDNIDPTILATVVVPYILKNTQTVKLNSNQLTMHFKIIDHFICIIKEKTLSRVQSNQFSVPNSLLPANNKVPNTFNSKCFTSIFDPTISNAAQPIIIPSKLSNTQPSSISALRPIKNSPPNYFNSSKQIFQNQDFSLNNVGNSLPNYNALHELNSYNNCTSSMSIFNSSDQFAISNQNFNSNEATNLMNLDPTQSPQQNKPIAKHDQSFLNFDHFG
uniref:SCY1-like protein 2 (Trinotate prediction) n=1 Tax=Myxobolus squamalis TaxID=59785 RepID=A0A6B2FZF0_MYXSQ